MEKAAVQSAQKTTLPRTTLRAHMHPLFIAHAEGYLARTVAQQKVKKVNCWSVGLELGAATCNHVVMIAASYVHFRRPSKTVL